MQEVVSQYEYKNRQVGPERLNAAKGITVTVAMTPEQADEVWKGAIPTRSPESILQISRQIRGEDRTNDAIAEQLAAATMHIYSPMGGQDRYVFSLILLTAIRMKLDEVNPSGVIPADELMFVDKISAQALLRGVSM